LPAVYWTNWLSRKEDIGAVVISHLLPLGHAAHALHRLRGIPYVVCTHGMDVALAMSQGDRKRNEARRILAGASHVVANSPHTAGLVEALGVPKDKIIIVRPSPSGALDREVGENEVKAVREKYGLGGDFVLLSVGRLVSRKDFGLVIEAVAALKWRGIFVRYLVVGEGPERAALEAKAEELAVTDRVHFAGAVPAAELSSLYAASDVFVTTPKSDGADIEGFGTVYLDAGLMGKPVIASRSGGVPDAVCHGETGLLIDPGDVKGLAEVIEKFRNDPELCKRMGAAGKKRVQRDFAPGTQTRPLITALKEMLEE
jgi:phosphatidylinositol alpha-1,6-mannosyltransferase